MAEHEPLASVEDVSGLLGRDLTPTELNRVTAILVKASELFRHYSGQQFTPNRSKVMLNVRPGGIVVLPQRPVQTVHTVTTPDGKPVGWNLAGTNLYVTAAAVGWPQLVVDYSHGDVVPDLVRMTVADVSQKVLTIPDDASSGVQQATTVRGPFTESRTYATWALGGQAAFAPADIAVAKTYRAPLLGSIHVR